MSQTHVSEAPGQGANTSQGRNPWLVLAVLAGAIFMLLLDTTIVNVAQVKIREGLNADLSEIQWILDSYLLAFAVLLLTFGRLGDVFGRKRLFITGMAIFAASSALCAASSWVGDVTGLDGATTLIIFRAIQGAGGAFMMPQTLSLITVVFPPERRGAAMGIWGGITALGAVFGPIIGGLIVTNYAWEWVFLINVPVGIVGIVAAIAIIPESRDPEATTKPDWGGILLSGAGIFAIVFALIEGNSYGWTSPEILALIGLGAVLIAAFVWWELRHHDPMMKVELFKFRNFWVGNIITGVMAFGMFGIFFPITIFLQAILGYTPIRAGFALTPMAFTIMLVAPVAGRLSDKIGSRWLLVGGLSTAATGVFFLTTRISLETSIWDLFPALVVTGLGMGMTFPPMTNATMKEVPPRISGSASGILNTVRNVGQVLGIAILGSVLQSWAGSFTSDELANVQIDPALKSRVADLAGAGRTDVIPTIIPADQSAQLPAVMQAVSRAFVDAMQNTFYVSITVLLTAAATALLIRNVVMVRETEEAPVEQRERPRPDAEPQPIGK
ncbi:MAG: DHA2 family efflux MFS transporter permease subunit [Thermomicrobiales bacterium]